MNTDQIMRGLKDIRDSPLGGIVARDYVRAAKGFIHWCDNTNAIPYSTQFHKSTYYILAMDEQERASLMVRYILERS